MPDYDCDGSFGVHILRAVRHRKATKRALRFGQPYTLQSTAGIDTVSLGFVLFVFLDTRTWLWIAR